MKKMFKFIAVMLCFAMILMPVTAFAEADVPAETKYLMGDVNGDGKIRTNDARLALRMSAGLESKKGIPDQILDADGNGRFNVSDARKILRVSANIDKFTCGFDANGLPNAVNVIKKGTYHISADTDGFNMIVAKSGKSIYMTSDDINDMMKDEGIAAILGDVNCGTLLRDGVIYALIASADPSSSFYIGFDMSKEDAQDMDAAEMSEMAALIDQYFNVNDASVMYSTVDGKKCISYSYVADGLQCVMYTDLIGNVLRIDVVDEHSYSATVTINYLTLDIPDYYMNLGLYTMMN